MYLQNMYTFTVAYLYFDIFVFIDIYLNKTIIVATKNLQNLLSGILALISDWSVMNYQPRLVSGTGRVRVGVKVGLGLG